MPASSEVAWSGMDGVLVERLMAAADLDTQATADQVALDGLSSFCAHYMAGVIAEDKADSNVEDVAVASPDSAKSSAAPGEEAAGSLSEAVAVDSESLLRPLKTDCPSIAAVLRFYARPRNRGLVLDEKLRERLKDDVEILKECRPYQDMPQLHKLILDILAYGIAQGRKPGPRTYKQLEQIYSGHIEGRLSEEPFAVAFCSALRSLNLLDTLPASQAVGAKPEALSSRVFGSDIIKKAAAASSRDAAESDGRSGEVKASLEFIPYGPFGEVLQQCIQSERLTGGQAMRIQTHALRVAEGAASSDAERKGSYQSAQPLRPADVMIVERWYANHALQRQRVLPALLRSRTPITLGVMFIGDDVVKRQRPPAEVNARPGPHEIAAWSLSVHLAEELERVLVAGEVKKNRGIR